MDALEDSVKEDVQELYSHISDISSWLPRFLRCLKRYESLPSPTEFPRVVTSIGREFKVVLADMKSKVPAMKRVETLKCRVWPYLKAAGEGEGSDGAENLAVNLQLLQLEWQKTCALVREVHGRVVDAVKRACAQTFLDESNNRRVSLGDLSDIEEEEEEREEEEDEEGDREEEEEKEVKHYSQRVSTHLRCEAPFERRRRKFHFAVDSDESIELQLAKISSQMLESSAAVTSMEPCQLSVVDLELRRGELQALKTILEIHHSEVTYMLETMSPVSSSSNQMVLFALDDLWQKCSVLIKHFEETLEQYWEVLELVTAFEEDMTHLLRDLRNLGIKQLPTWSDFEQAFHKLKDHQSAIVSLDELSTQLLTLEPIFSGECIRCYMKELVDLYSNAWGELRAALQAHIAEKEEAFSCDLAMVRSWSEQAVLLLNYFGTYQAAEKRERTHKELTVHQEMLTKVEQGLNRMISVAAQCGLPPVADLVGQVEEVEEQLHSISLTLRAQLGDFRNGMGDTNRLSGIFSLQFGDLEHVIHQMTHQVLQTPTVPMETRSEVLHEVDGKLLLQLPAKLQSEVEEVTQSIQDLSQSVAMLKLPTGLDLVEVHLAVDTCRTHQRFLDTIHHRITELVDQKGKTQANGLLDLHLCNLSSRWQQASVTLADKLNALHGREAEIARFNQQVSSLVQMVEKAQSFVLNPPLDLVEFTVQCNTMKDKMVAAEGDRQAVLMKLNGLPNLPSSPQPPKVTQRKQLTQRWTQVLHSLERVSTNKEAVLVRFTRAWEEWAEHASEEVGSLLPTGCTLASIASKHTQAQQMRQNAEAILRSLATAPQTDQTKGLSQNVDQVLQESGRLEKVLSSRLSELRAFLSEYSALKTWLNDMNVLVQGEQHCVKRQTLCQQIVLKEKSVNQLKLMTQQLIQQEWEGEREGEGEGESSSERTRLVMRAKELFGNWDSLCQQCIPAGVVQSGLRRESLPQKEFSSPADLLKWLMGVATKLRPQSQCLSQQQVEDALLDVKTVAQDLANLHVNYEQLVGGEDVSTWVANQRKRLISLWAEVSSLVKERERSLGELDVLWKQFNEQKERVVEFMRTAELQMCHPSVLGRSDIDLSVIDAELGGCSELSNDISQWESEMISLGSLATKLSHHRHDSSESSDLQKVMMQLANRWKSIKEKFRTQWPHFEVMKSVWSDYYTSYRRLQAGVTQLKVEVSELNAPPTTIKIIALQKDIVKDVLLESEICLGFVDVARSKLLALADQVGTSLLNTAMLSEKIDRLVQELEQLAETARAKQAMLEGVLLERQQIINELAASCTWLQHAESLLRGLRPVGRDLVDVGRQYRSIQGFWVEFEEQRDKICRVLVASTQLLYGQADTNEERTIVELVRMQHARVSENWGRVQEEAIQAKETLDKTYPEFVRFQSLCTQVGQLLTAAEMTLASAQPIAQTLPRLRLQAARHEELQTSIEPIAQHLEDIQQSASDLKDGGCDLSPDLVNLAKRFERRWKDVSQYAHARSLRLNESLSKFGSAPVRDGTLPRGWSKVQHANGAAEYSVTTQQGRKYSQRMHPDLVTTLRGLEAKFSHVKFDGYRVALKVRALQKSLQLHLVSSKSALLILLRYLDETTPTLEHSEVVQVLSALYQQAHSDHGDRVQVGRSVDMATSWMMVTYDRACEGRVSTVALKVGVVFLCGGKLDDKLKCFFQLFANSQGEITVDVLGQILEYSLMIQHSVGEEEQFPMALLDQTSQAFERPTRPLKLAQWLSWLHSEPKPLAWVPMIHRLAQSEHCRHDIRCFICRVNPILGFRYRCMQCFRVDLCQDCFWARRSTDRHLLTHPMQEYCRSPKLTQDIKDFFKVLGRRMTRSSRRTPRQVPPPPAQPSAVAQHHGMHVQTEATSSEASVSIPSLLEVPDAMDDDLDSLIAQLETENRELALQLESMGASEFGSSDSISSQLLSLQESRQALELRIHYLQTQNAKLLAQIGRLKAIVHQRQDFDFVEV